LDVGVSEVQVCQHFTSQVELYAHLLPSQVPGVTEFA
jgi:hypothetical protein